MHMFFFLNNQCFKEKNTVKAGNKQIHFVYVGVDAKGCASKKQHYYSGLGFPANFIFPAL